MPRKSASAPRTAANDTPPTALPSASNQSVAMSVRILDELAAAAKPIGVSDLARRLGESKGRIHRHLSTMRALGLVSQEAATERYGLGWKLLQLGAAANENFGIRSIAQEHLEALRDSTEHTAAFAIPANKEALLLTSVMSENRIAIMVKEGVTVSASASALGRVVLAFSTPEMQAQVLEGPLRRYTNESLSDSQIVAQRFRLIQQRYYDVAVNENTYGISTLAAPVFDESGDIVGSVGIIGSPYSIPAHPDPELIRKVQICAQTMSEALGSRRWSTVLTEQ